MSGLGLLGAFAGGVAKSRVDTLQKEEDFNLKKALMDAEVDKQMRLEEAKHTMQSKWDDEAVAKKQGILKSARDRVVGSAGGYQTPEMKADEDRRVLEAQASDLSANGIDNKFEVGQMASKDKAAHLENQLEFMKQKLEATTENQKRLAEIKDYIARGQLDVAQQRIALLQDKASRVDDIEMEPSLDKVYTPQQWAKLSKAQKNQANAIQAARVEVGGLTGDEDFLQQGDALGKKNPNYDRETAKRVAKAQEKLPGVADEALDQWKAKRKPSVKNPAAESAPLGSKERPIKLD